MAWRIHQVAYVENLYPRRYSNFSTAFINPMFPSWIKSRNDKPRLVYFLAIEITSRRFASTISVLARSAFRSQSFRDWYCSAYSSTESQSDFSRSRDLIPADERAPEPRRCFAVSL